MRTLTYISDNGQIASFVNRAPYYFDKLVSGAESSAQTEKTPRQDGATTYSVSLNPRTISLKGYIHAEGNTQLNVKTVIDEHKSFLDSCFNPKTFGTLIYNNERGGQIIRARPVTTPIYGDIVNYQNVQIDIDFESDSSYWESYKLYEKNINTVENKWTFPFTLPLKFGEQYAELSIKNPTKTIIEPYFEIYTNSNDVTIENITAGTHLTVEHAILQEQMMIIDSKTATVKLKTDTEIYDVSNWITTDSNFIELLPGNNVLKVYNSLQNNQIQIKIFYRLPVMGV